MRKVFDDAAEMLPSPFQDWVKANALHFVILLWLAAQTYGEITREQSDQGLSLTSLSTRVSTLENFHRDERGRLDPIYLPRDTAIAQNAEILRRLDSIERQLAAVMSRR